jgi:hypothetical protein
MEQPAKPRRKFSWRRVLLIIFMIYLIIIAIVCYSPSKLVLMPTTRPISVTNAERRLIPSSVGSVEVWTRRNTAAQLVPPDAYVLAFIGNGSRAERELDRISPMWSKYPVEIWAVNYPGYGGSEGEALLKNIPPATLAVYDALAKVANGKPIFLSGHSLGTTVAIGIAAQRPVAGLVLHNPPPLRHLIFERYGWFNLWLGASYVAESIPVEMRSLTNGPNCHAPAVFLLAGRDTVVPPRYQDTVFRDYAGPKHAVRMPTYLHNDPLWVAPELPQAEKEIDWLWQSAMRQNH